MEIKSFAVSTLQNYLIISADEIDGLVPNGSKTSAHDDVIKWEHFPRYWPFVWEIHQSPVRPVTRSFHVFFDPHLNKRLSKQW